MWNESDLGPASKKNCRTNRTAFILHKLSLLLFNLVNSIILGCHLGLLAAIIPKRSWIKEIRPIKTRLGPIAHWGDLYFQRLSSPLTLDENQLLTIKFNHSYEVWSEAPPEKAK